MVDDEPVPTKKESHNAIFFNKKQCNVGFRLPFPSLVKQFLHYTKIPSSFIHPNVVRVLMGCNILDLIFHLNLFLLEILFIYTIKMSQKGMFSMSAQIPSLQLVIELPDSNMGGAKEHVLVSGQWVGLLDHLDRDFFSMLYAEYLEYNWFCFLLFVLCSLLIVILVLTLLLCV